MTSRTIFILLVLLGQVTALYPQTTARERIEQRRQQEQQSTSVADIQKNQQNFNLEEEISNSRWSRIIYRYLDLSKEANAPLYDPATPVDGQMNLFSKIFRLLQEKRIKAFEYLDGREAFTGEYQIDFQEFLDRFGIYYESAGDRIMVNDADIPGNEVQGYFVKEVYFFDRGSSRFVVMPLALCPVLQRQGDNDATTTRYPLFWIPYGELEPYTRQMSVMASGLNNSRNGTVDDFFRKRTYDGEIYKAQNPRNLTISQYTTTPEEMKTEQERIEKELTDFEQNLWKSEGFIPQPEREASRPTKDKSAKSSSATTQTMRDRRY